MARKTKLNIKALHLVICIFCAFFLWFYVSYVVSPKITQTITNIPVTITGEEDLNNSGYSAKLISDNKVDVKVTADRGDFYKINAKNARATVDVSNFEDAGVYPLKASVSFVSVAIPTGDINTDKAFLEFEVSAYKTTKHPVYITWGKAPTDGYYVEKSDHVTESDSFTVVSGGEEDVKLVHKVETEKVDLSSVTDTVTKELALICFDEQGNEIKGVKLSPDKVSVTFTIYKEATVPLTVTLPEGEEKADFTITPKEVKVKGPAAAVDELTEINLGNLGELKRRPTGNIRTKKDGVVLAEDEVTKYEITFPQDEEGELQ
jgi:YbbR domain-containing protein